MDINKDFYYTEPKEEQVWLVTEENQFVGLDKLIGKTITSVDSKNGIITCSDGSRFELDADEYDYHSCGLQVFEVRDS